MTLKPFVSQPIYNYIFWHGNGVKKSCQILQHVYNRKYIYIWPPTKMTPPNSNQKTALRIFFICIYFLGICIYIFCIHKMQRVFVCNCIVIHIHDNMYTWYNKTSVYMKKMHNNVVRKLCMLCNLIVRYAIKTKPFNESYPLCIYVVQYYTVLHTLYIYYTYSSHCTYV